MSKFSIHLLFQNTGRMAFWCMIISWVMQLAIFEETIQPAFPLSDIFGEQESLAAVSERIFIMAMIGRVWLLSGILLIIKGFVYKEPKGLAFKLAFAGLTLMVLLEASIIIMSLITVG